MFFYSPAVFTDWKMLLIDTIIDKHNNNIDPLHILEDILPSNQESNDWLNLDWESKYGWSSTSLYSLIYAIYICISIECLVCVCVGWVDIWLLFLVICRVHPSTCVCVCVFVTRQFPLINWIRIELRGIGGFGWQPCTLLSRF